VAWATVPGLSDDGPLVWRAERGASEHVPVDALARELCTRGESGSVLVMPATLRPIVLLQDRPQGVLGDVLALATIGLEALSEEDRGRVREQEEPSLFHLPLRPSKYGLHHEAAVDLNALTRLSASLVLPRAVGTLDANEMRVIGERLVTHLDLDIEPVVAAEVEKLLTRLAGPEML
jgi:hypothetical protein